MKTGSFKVFSNEELKGMSSDELTDVLNDTDQDIQKLSAYQQIVHDIREGKNMQAIYAAKVAQMTPIERRALAQALSPVGIQTAEKVSDL